jgi:hypothetical protein
MRLSGDPIRQGFNEATSPSISGRIEYIVSGHWATRQNPTQTYQGSFEMAARDFTQFRGDLEQYLLALEQYEAALAAAGAPYTRGRKF